MFKTRRPYPSEPARALAVGSRAVFATISCLLALAPSLQDAPLPAAELREALDALRTGAPGEPAFDAALPRLPDLIRSRTAWFVAGGAYLAGEHGRRECVAALIDALDAGRGLREPDMEAVLDALIRLDAPLEPGRLVLDGRHAAETLILLSRDPKTHQGEIATLLAVCPEDEPARWAAACLLAEHRDRGIAAVLLGSTTWSADVVVREPGSDAAVGQGGGARYRSFPHPPWPLPVAYHLRLPCADEPLWPVRYERKRYGERLQLPTPVARSQSGALRARLLGALLEDADGPALAHDERELIVQWRDEATYEREVLAHIGGLRQKILHIGQALEARGFLTNGTATAARATIRVALHDLRAEGVGALPRPGIPSVVYD